MSDVVRQEIELNVREWKQKFDEYDNLIHRASKVKEEADLYGDKVASAMGQLDLTEHKTYYGKLTIKADKLTISSHSAVCDVPKRKKPARKKVDAEGDGPSF